MTASEVASAGGPALPVRPESRSEWRVDAMIHLIGVIAGLAGCLALTLVAAPLVDGPALASLAVYAGGLLAMLSCSAVYNVVGDGPDRTVWRRLDHAAIFVMIAATYTPFAVLTIGGAWGTGLLVFVWTAAAAGAALKLIYPDWHEALSIAAYLLLGWSILVAADGVVAAAPLATLLLLAGGGLLYSAGVPFYRWRRLPYHRAIWHGFVLAAATSHYGAILTLVAER